MGEKVPKPFSSLCMAGTELSYKSHVHIHIYMYYVEHWTGDVCGFTFQSKEIPFH